MHYKKTIGLFLLIAAISFAGCHKEKDQPSEENSRPYSRYLLLDYNSYIEIPHDPALNPASGMTLEGWIRLDNTAADNMIVYKRLYYKENGYYIQVWEKDDKPVLSSYVGYAGSLRKAGKFSILQWTHWAVTWDGTKRRHYINGELVGEISEEESPFTPSKEPLIFAKGMAAHTGLAEFRLWNVVRSGTQIKETMNTDITSPMPGLVAVWPLEENAKDIIGGHNGQLFNNPSFKVWEE